MARKLAIIGYGGMGGWHHENIRDHVAEIDVVGAWDIREEARAKAAENSLHLYESQLELLSDPQLDIVTIATPNNFHKEIAIAALLAGKNVVCEKPVTMDAAELRDIMAVAEKTGKLFSVHQNRRWDKDYVIIKKIINDDTIGKPYYFESRVQGSRRNLHGWRSYKVDGGGMVLDWGIHLLDQLLDLIDSPVVAVDAHLLQVYSKEVDDNFKTLLRFGNGISAMVEISTNCFIPQPRWHMSCENGTAVVENFACDGKMVKLTNEDEMAWADEIVYTVAGPTRTMAPRPQQTMTTMELPAVDSKWTDYYENIAAVLDGTAELIVKPEQALRVMTLVDAIFQCHEQGHGMKCNI